MRSLNAYTCLLAVASLATLAGCSTTATKTTDVTAPIRTSLNQAGLKDVSVSQNRDLGVITLGGHVPSDSDKANAEVIAKGLSGTQVVASEIAVLPPGAEKEAKQIDSALDKGIDANLDAALIAERLRDNVKYSVKTGVVTLTGEVDSQTKRARAETVAGGVPNVKQVVNELQIKGQKASSSN